MRSVLPSSITSSSKSVNVCASRLSTAAARNFSPFQTGMIMEMRGVILVGHAKLEGIAAGGELKLAAAPAQNFL